MTNIRVIIRTPAFRSSYTVTCAWADVHRATLKPLHNGLSSLRIIYTKKNDSEYTIMLLHAIPQTLAGQIVALCKRG